MGLIHQAGQVTKAVKNVGRLREIITAMTRFGFGTIVDKMGLRQFGGTWNTQELPPDDHNLGVRLRLLLQGLGPTFIKVGQILASRPDLLSFEIISELEKLQDQITPLSFETLRPLIEKDLGRPFESCFLSVDSTALASASIAQVHSAKTLEGQDVVIKIKKPGVEKLISQDLEILEILAGLMEHYLPELRLFKPQKLVQQFRRSLLAETNFILEANHTLKFRENFQHQNFLVIPKIFMELSGVHILTMERLNGVKLSDLEAVRKMGLNPALLLEHGLDAFFQSIMVHGFFHADPHAGNILVLPDARMGLLDFGSVVRLSKKSREAIVSMFLALLTENYEALVQEYVELSPESPVALNLAALEQLQNEVRDTFSPYFGLPLKDIPMGKLLLESTRIAFRHQVYLPNDLVMVFKTIMTLEGLGRTLDPHFNLIDSASKFAKMVLSERYAPDRIAKDLFRSARDYTHLLESLPRQLSSILRQLENGQFKVQIQAHSLESQTHSENARSQRTQLCLLSIGTLVAASILSYSGVESLLGLQGALWGLSLALVGISLWKIFSR